MGHDRDVRLGVRGFSVTARTPFLLTMQVDNVDVSLYPTGKMLVQCDDPAPIADKVLEAIA